MIGLRRGIVVINDAVRDHTFTSSSASVIRDRAIDQRAPRRAAAGIREVTGDQAIDERAFTSAATIRCSVSSEDAVVERCSESAAAVAVIGWT